VITVGVRIPRFSEFDLRAYKVRGTYLTVNQEFVSAILRRPAIFTLQISFPS